MKKCFKYLKIIFLLVVLWIMIISFSIKVNAFSFKPYTYRLDSTGKYILNIKGYTTLKKFKNNIRGNIKIKFESVYDDADEEAELVKTGDEITIDDTTYIAVVSGDIDGDGKVTYKDILLEQDYIDSKGKKTDRYAYEGDYQKRRKVKIDGSIATTPYANSIKLFTKTATPIQNFAITDVGTSNQIVWLGCNPGNDPKNFTVRGYTGSTSNNIGKEKYKVRLTYGGHQCLSIWKQTDGKYNIYTGSYAAKGLYSKEYNRTYYNPRGVNKLEYSLSTGNIGSNLATKGIKVSNKKINICALGVDESTNKMVLVHDGKAYVYNVNPNNFNRSKEIKSFKLSAVSGNTIQGGCLVGNFFYIVTGKNAKEMKIFCYDIETGDKKFEKKTNVSNKLGNAEPEGIQVYNYNGKNRVFVGFNQNGIWYFDS